jgi:hypothetical protein
MFSLHQLAAHYRRDCSLHFLPQICFRDLLHDISSVLRTNKQTDKQTNTFGIHNALILIITVPIVIILLQDTFIYT